jgi:hypothetical protein
MRNIMRFENSHFYFQKTTPTSTKGVYFGVLLLSIAIFADALVPNIQQVLMRTRTASPEEIAIKVNTLSAFSVFIFLLLSQAISEWYAILVVKYPISLGLMCVSGLTMGVAIIAMTLLIQEAGSVVAVAVATVRKVLTITLSYVVYPGHGKQFDRRHAVGAVLVVLGMGLSWIWTQGEKCRESKEETEEGDLEAVPLNSIPEEGSSSQSVESEN